MATASASPVMKPAKPLVDSTNEYIGKSSTMEFGVVKDSVAEIVANPVSMSDVEAEAFMNEPVMVVVNASGKDNEAEFVSVSVNGVIQMFKRGTPIIVKRKYVERLARAKETHYAQTVDAQLGENMNLLTANPAMRYPFQVMRDDNPQGAEWLRTIMAS